MAIGHETRVGGDPVSVANEGLSVEGSVRGIAPWLESSGSSGIGSFHLEGAVPSDQVHAPRL